MDSILFYLQRPGCGKTPGNTGIGAEKIMNALKKKESGGSIPFLP